MWTKLVGVLQTLAYTIRILIKNDIDIQGLNRTSRTIFPTLGSQTIPYSSTHRLLSQLQPATFIIFYYLKLEPHIMNFNMDQSQIPKGGEARNENPVLLLVPLHKKKSLVKELLTKQCHPFANRC